MRDGAADQAQRPPLASWVEREGRLPMAAPHRAEKRGGARALLGHVVVIHQNLRSKNLLALEPRQASAPGCRARTGGRRGSLVLSEIFRIQSRTACDSLNRTTSLKSQRVKVA